MYNKQIVFQLYGHSISIQKYKKEVFRFIKNNDHALEIIFRTGMPTWENQIYRLFENFTRQLENIQCSQEILQTVVKQNIQKISPLFLEYFECYFQNGDLANILPQMLKRLEK